jgi:hypothetical protein
LRRRPIVDLYVNLAHPLHHFNRSRLRRLMCGKALPFRCILWLFPRLRLAPEA